jgi:hypothetical protein
MTALVVLEKMLRGGVHVHVAEEIGSAAGKRNNSNCNIGISKLNDKKSTLLSLPGTQEQCNVVLSCILIFRAYICHI